MGFGFFDLAFDLLHFKMQFSTQFRLVSVHVRTKLAFIHPALLPPDGTGDVQPVLGI